MALTASQSNDVNTLLNWVMDHPNHLGEHVNAQQAEAAAQRLADAAFRTLYAGLSGQDVRRLWCTPAPLAGPAAKPRKAKAMKDPTGPGSKQP